MDQQIWKTLAIQDKQTVYAIIDGAADEHIVAHIDAHKVDGYPLLKRLDLPDSYKPWLVKLEPDNTFTKWFLSEGFTKYWGTIFVSNDSLDKLKNHFLEYIQVFNEQANTPALMRFYDPKIFYSFTGLLDEKQLAEFFAPLQYVATIAPFKDQELRIFKYTDKKILLNKHDLTKTENESPEEVKEETTKETKK